MRERAAPKVSGSIAFLHEEAKRSVLPKMEKSGTKLLAFTREKLVPKTVHAGKIAAQYANDYIAPKAQRSLAVAFAAFVRANKKSADVTKRWILPAAKRAGKYAMERGIPLAKRAGKEVVRVTRERVLPGSRAVANTLLEKTITTVDRLGTKSRWERDVAKLSRKSGVDRETLARILHAFVKEGKVTLSGARSALWNMHEHAKGNKELSRWAFLRVHEDVRNGINPLVTYRAMLDTLREVQRNPELARNATPEKLEAVYQKMRSRHFLQSAEPPTMEEILEKMRMTELKDLLMSQHPQLPRHGS